MVEHVLNGLQMIRSFFGPPPLSVRQSVGVSYAGIIPCINIIQY